MKNFIKKLAYIIAIAIICFALLVVLLRVVTPYLNNYRESFEKWASELLHLPVKIQTVSVDWYRYQPAITFNQTTLYSAETKEPILEVNKIRILLSVTNSIWQWKPVLSAIQISGADITIHQNAQGELSVQGFPALTGFNQEPFKKETKFVSVLKWLAVPSHLILHDIDIQYIGLTGKQRHVTLYGLTLKNEDNNHQLYGKAILHQTLPTNVTVAVNWQGNVEDVQNIMARGYLYVSGFSLSEWLKGLSWQDWQVQRGLASAKIWGTWEHNQLQKVQARINAYALDLYHAPTKTHQNVTRFSGNIGWMKTENQYIVAGDDILIDFPEHLWPTNQFYLIVDKNTEGKLIPKVMNIGYIDLRDVQRVLPYFEKSLPEKIVSVLPKLRLRGYLQNLQLTLPENLNDWQKAKLDVNIINLTTDEWDKFPAISNFTSTVSWENGAGTINILSKRFKIAKKTLFSLPFYSDYLAGNLDIKNINNEWNIATERLTVNNDDMKGSLTGNIKFSDITKPIVDVNAQLSINNVAKITNYLPMQTFEPDLKKWLQQAFLAGELTQAKIVIKGPLQDFPFDNDTGSFDVTGAVSNLTLHYDSEWPTIENINGTINFHNRQMQVNASSSETSGINLRNIQADIPYLGDDKPTILTIKGDPLNFDLTEGAKFIRKTPLNKKLGIIFNRLNLTGKGNLNLQLTIPLDDPDKTQVLGDLSLTDAKILLSPWDLPITNLQGQLQFTENSVTANTMTAELFAKPININLSTINPNAKDSVIRANFSSQVQLSNLQKWLKIPFDKIASGETQILGEIDVTENKPLAIKIKSDLQGVKVKLPDELSKNINQSRSFTTYLFIAENAPLKVKLDYGDIKAALVLDTSKKETKLISTVLHIGSGDVNWAKDPGLYITGNLKEINWQQIKMYLNDDKSKSSLPISMSNLKNINVNIEDLIFGGQVFNDVNVVLTPNPNSWKIVFDSDDIDGQIQVPNTLKSNDPIVAQLNRLELHSSEKKQTSDQLQLDVKSLPPISFNSDSVIYDGRPLGTINFLTQPTRRGLAIKQLRIVSSRMLLVASGEWTQSGKKQTTDLQGTLTSQRLTELVRSLQLDSHNFIASNGRLQFDFTWPDAPYAASLATLDGAVSIDIGRGQILEIGSESSAKMNIGKILNIFSLQSIPRRLTLDFSDLTQKGYGFDSIKGDFNFQNGNAHTTNLRFDGPLAKVQISGRIGFRQRDVDLLLQVTPNVTSSIPVAATLITVQPLVGVAAWAVSKVMSPQISKATTSAYSVTGSWDNPRWESARAR